MAHKETRDVWIATDGTEFDSEAEAVARDRHLELVAEMVADRLASICWPDDAIDGIAKWVLKRYTLTRKEG